MRFLSTIIIFFGSIVYLSSNYFLCQPPPPGNPGGSVSTLAFDADGYVVPNNISPLSISILRYGDVSQPCSVTVACQSPSTQELFATRSTAAIVGVDYLCGGSIQTTTTMAPTTTTPRAASTTTVVAGGPFPPPPPPPGPGNTATTTSSPTTSAPTTTAPSTGVLLLWPPGDGSMKNISFPLFHSIINGTRKTFRVAMQAPVGCFLGDPSNALVYINYLPQVGPVTTTPPPPTSTTRAPENSTSTTTSNPTTTTTVDISSSTTQLPLSSTGINNERNECYKDSIARDYRGTVAITKSGKQCQAWSSQSPHTHNITSDNYPNADLVENYCRNPTDDGSNSAWCFTTDTNTIREDCSIGEPWQHCVVVLPAESNSGLSNDAKIGLGVGLGVGGGLLLLAAGIGYYMKKNKQDNNNNNEEQGGGGDVLNNRHNNNDDKNLPAIHELKAIDAVNLVPKHANNNEEKEPPASAMGMMNDNNNNNNNDDGMLYDGDDNNNNNMNNNNNNDNDNNNYHNRGAIDDERKSRRPSKNHSRSRSNKNKLINNNNYNNNNNNDSEIDLESGEFKLNIVE